VDADLLDHLEVKANTMANHFVTHKPAPFSLKDFLYSFLLIELFKGMALTGRYLFRR
jgi:NADH-quinone oxidoreductase subunit I